MTKCSLCPLRGKLTQEVSYYYRFIDDEYFDYQRGICTDCYNLLVNFGTDKEIFAKVRK